MSEVTIYTLAKELNMTPSMVSRALSPTGKVSEQKRRIVLEAAQKQGYTPNKLASRLSMRTIRIGIIINCGFDVNRDKMLCGIEAAHEQLKDYKIKYDITLLNSAVSKPDEYIKAAHKYRDFDGIIVTGMSNARYTDVLRTMTEANPNVTQVQAVNRDVDTLFSSKHDERVASRLSAQFLYSCLKRSERKNVVLFTGNLESDLHRGARAAFSEACSELGLNLFQAFDMKDNEDCLASIVPTLFKTHGDSIDGLYITSGISEPLCSYLHENNIDIPTVTFDTHDSVKYYLQNGVISATVFQNVQSQMEKAFKLLAWHIISGEKIPRTVYTDVQLVLAANMHQFD